MELVAGVITAVVGAFGLWVVNRKSVTIRRLEELEHLQSVLLGLNPGPDRKKIADYHERRARSLASYLRPEAEFGRALVWALPMFVLTLGIVGVSAVIMFLEPRPSIVVVAALGLIATFPAWFVAFIMQGWHMWHEAKLAKVERQERLAALLE